MVASASSPHLTLQITWGTLRQVFDFLFRKLFYKMAGMGHVDVDRRYRRVHPDSHLDGMVYVDVTMLSSGPDPGQGGLPRARPVLGLAAPHLGLGLGP